MAVGELVPCNGFTDVIADLSSVEDAEPAIAARDQDGCAGSRASWGCWTGSCSPAR
ncbi:hypothetical protein [Lentzea sp.]|uniref:hypothetical protein n=1 Tax=Lentzea sp. TaxID=56099 RepID=UPI002B6656AF|nr:hypothetical protein [Lentzea sp.]HUQ54658.1 hypothetical protein [Lentzea sp.]